MSKRAKQPEEAELPSRPTSIYFVTLWSLARAIMPLLGLLGLYRIYREFHGVGASLNFLQMWADEFSMFDKIATAVSIVQAAVFVYVAIGVFFGLRWGRTGFLWASIGVLFWNLARGLLTFRFGLALYSLIALCLASWYFRQPTILDYFGAEDTAPQWAKTKIGRLPLDLAAFFGVTILVAFAEILGVFQILPMFTR